MKAPQSFETLTHIQIPENFNPHFIILFTVFSRPAQPLVWCVDHRYLLAYSLTPWSRVLLEKLTGSQLVKKFPAFTSAHFMVLHLIRSYVVCTSLSVESATELHTCLLDESKHCGNICYLIHYQVMPDTREWGIIGIISREEQKSGKPYCCWGRVGEIEGNLSHN